MRVACLSDLHGQLPPKEKIPECDLLIMAGDIEGACSHPFAQTVWIHEYFRPWLWDVAKKVPKIIGIAGNHSWAYWPEYRKYLVLPSLEWEYLQESHTHYKGFTIYGTPCTNPFFKWAFMSTEEKQKEQLSKVLPETNIIVSHGPPYGYGDPSLDGDSVGSKALLARIDELQNLDLVVCGHLHSGYGVYKRNNTTIVNAALLDESYKMVREPIVVEIPDREVK